MSAEPATESEATVLPDEIAYDPDEADQWGAFAETALTPAEAVEAAVLDELAGRHAMFEK